jgi:TonB family protein
LDPNFSCPHGYPNPPIRIYYGKMSAVLPAIENPPSAPVPQLLVELPPRHHVFWGNLRDLVFPRHPAPLELRSAPAAFWPDVFVQSPLPWSGFLKSVVYHVVACVLLIGVTRFFALQPRVVATPQFERSQVVYYQASEYLPPLDTRSAAAERPRKTDPAFSRQAIISVPAEADNRSQTIVTPPNVRLKRDVALPNIVAWNDRMSDEKRPQLAIPPAPLTPAADISRIASRLAPSVVAPPPDVRTSNRPASTPGLQPELIAPPPAVDVASTRALGDMNMGRAAVIAPAPQLPVAEQRSAPGGRFSAAGSVAAQVVPPPPSVSSGASSGSSGSSFGARGHVIALSLNPAVGAPPDPPAGNRRGTFAATPEGHAGASGDAGAVSDAKGNGSGSGAKASDLPAGLYVGSTAGKSSTVAGESSNKGPANSVNPNLTASVSTPRVTSAPHPMQPSSTAKLSEPERSVFGDRKFYSVTLNMPNLNSGGGSWVIRFAELNHAASDHASSGDANAPAVDLTQPMATRKVDPAYPQQLMRENVHGTVILYAVIHADGSVGSVRVLRGVDERLDRFASEAVAQWQFQPATKSGSPVDVEATFQIPFRPSRLGSDF